MEEDTVYCDCGQRLDWGDEGAFIECTECGGAISGETGTEATKKWNRRANDEID